MLFGQSSSELSNKVYELSGKIKALEKDIRLLEKMIDNDGYRIDKLQERIAESEQKVGDAGALQERIAELEKMIDNDGYRIDKLQERIAELEQKVGDAGALQERIAELEQKVDVELTQRNDALAAEWAYAVPDEDLQRRTADALSEAQQKQAESLRAAIDAAPSAGIPSPAGVMPAQCFFYSDTPDGMVITGLNLFEYPETISVPAIIDGKPVCKIGDSAFQKNAAIRNVILPKTVKELGREAFSGSSLLSVSAPSVTTLGEDCFRRCYTLHSASLPSVETVGYRCFEECEALTSIELPAATSFGQSCFQHCRSLRSAHIPKAEVLDTRMFLASGLTEIHIPGSVKIIPDGCFSSCKDLKKVVLSEGLEGIGMLDDAFSHVRLSSLILPKSVRYSHNNKEHLLGYHLYVEKLAVLGMTTAIGGIEFDTIYCLPGSNAHRYSQKKGCRRIRPLSEFDEE